MTNRRWELRRRRAGAGKVARSARRQLMLDALEDRTLLAVTSTFASGVLTLISDAGDSIVVSSSGGNVRTTVNGTPFTPTDTIAASTVTMLNVIGGPLANAIDLSGVSASAYTSLTDVHVSGGDGDDVLTGSPFDDVLSGGAGNDTIFGAAGNDAIFGGTGNDSLVGGGGADTIFGDTFEADSSQLIGLNAAGSALVRFNAGATTTTRETPIIGIPAGQTLIGLDTRPANGSLYAVTNQAGVGRLYTIDTVTGFASPVADISGAMLAGANFGVDFNPVVDALRIVSDTGQNLRVNVTTGAAATDTALAYAAGDPNNGTPPVIAGAAYTNPVAGATATLLYDIDSNLKVLAQQNPANAGTLTTIGALGVTPTAVLGFDIEPGSNQAVAALVVGGSTGLYTIDLTTGAATLVGPIGDGMTGFASLSTPTDLSVNTMVPDNDTIVWNNGDGSDTIDGGTGADTQFVNGSSQGDVFSAEATGGHLVFSRTNLIPFALQIDNVEALAVDGKLGDDTLTVQPLTGLPTLTLVNYVGGAGNDRLSLADGATLQGGSYDGGEGVDTVDYSGYTTPVTVDLSAGSSFFTAMLSGANEVPPNTSPATGTGTFVLNPAGTDLSFNPGITYTDLQGQFLGVLNGQPVHFHQGAAGTNGPIVYSLTPAQLNGLTTPDGFFTGSWTSTDPVVMGTPPSGPLTPALVQALNEGNIYLNIHTTEFPGGEIRGQLMLTGTQGSSTGLSGLMNVEDAVGGQAADTITGNAQGNMLTGGPGNDTINGLGGDDVIVWNNGDGSDSVDGGLGVDTQLVNGSVNADNFMVAAGTGGRLAFSRTGTGPFTLNIGTVEDLKVRAGLGQDTITVGDLTGVADIKTLDLDGEFENDTIDASALPAGLVATILSGGAGNDSIIGSPGIDSIYGGQGDDTIVGGKGNDVIDAGITPEHALFAALTDTDSVLIFNADTANRVMTVPLTGLQGGEKAIGVAFRPGYTPDELYVLTDAGRIYRTTPNGALMGEVTLVADPSDTTSPYTAITGEDFGVNFNPVADRLRTVSNTGQDLRSNVETGATITDGALAYAAGDTNSGSTPAVAGAAYTNAYADATSTSLYDIDAGLGVLALQNPPNSGVLNTVGSLGVTTTSNVGFDILPGSDQTAFATLQVGGVTGLYTIDLKTGAATLVHVVGQGTDSVISLAAAPDNDTIIWNNGDGSDTVDGGAGDDTQVVNGGSADEAFALAAGMNGRVTFSRTTPNPFSLDLGTIENITVNGNAGNDSLVAGDLTGVTALDQINFNGGDGDDTLNGAGLVALISIAADGGAGNDTLIGGPADDNLDGGAGNNLAVPNAGRNTISHARITPGDYDGDGKTDAAVYTPATTAGGLGLFEVTYSSTGEKVAQRLGGMGAFPVSGDYNGDGLADFGVYQYDATAGFSSFTILPSGGGATITQPFGGASDFPVSGDYNGDGITDFAVYGFSPDNGFSRFAILLSGGGGSVAQPFGGPSDFPVAGDYNGDGITDIAVYGFSPDNGFSRFGVLPSGGGSAFAVPFGGPLDAPVAGDANGDHVTDYIVYGPAGSGQQPRFAVMPSGGGAAYTIPYGTTGSIALPPYAGLFTLPTTPTGTATAAQKAATNGRPQSRPLDAFDKALADLAGSFRVRPNG